MRINKGDALIYVAFALIFFNAFSTIPVFVNTGIACYAMIFSALFLIYIYGSDRGKITLYKNRILAWFLLLLPMLYNNYDVKNGWYYQILYYYSFFLIMVFLSNRNKWTDKPWKVIRCYCTIHFIAGIFLMLNKDILYDYIIPLLYFSERGSGKRLLYEAINNGYMTGLCNHYSKMGMIMSLGVISMSGCIFEKKKEPKKILVLLLFIIGLGMTGKRGPFLFAILSILITLYCFSPNKLTKKQLLRIFVAAIATVALSVLAYIKIPQIHQLIERFFEQSNDINDLSTGRVELFWVNAWNLFKKHPFVGNGWRSFKRLVVSLFGNNNYNDAHNIYLQLLAEVGIIGFTAVVSFMVLTWRKTYKLIKETAAQAVNDETVVILKISLCYETFFLLYGFTGNPLYDMLCYFPYLLCCVIAWSTGYKNYLVGKGNEQ